MNETGIKLLEKRFKCHIKHIKNHQAIFCHIDLLASLLFLFLFLLLLSLLLLILLILIYILILILILLE